METKDESVFHGLKRASVRFVWSKLIEFLSRG